VWGPDGNLWFTEYAGNKIGRMNPAGQVINEYLLASNSLPIGIAVGPDGNLWFTENSGNKIGRITTAGQLTEFQTDQNDLPMGIAAGPDGNLWFTGQGGKIGQITIVGVRTEFPLPGSYPAGIAAGPVRQSLVCGVGRGRQDRADYSSRRH
jgi:virginiamycin B lyase